MRILGLLEIRQRLESYDFRIDTSTPEGLDRILRAQIEDYAKVIRAAG